MKYDVIVISDFHWDALDAIKQYNETEWIFKFIEKLPSLDLVVIAGDYFNTKILLNSKSSLYAIKWMGQLVKICKRKNAKIRIIRGTLSHDNNQLDSFNSYEAEDNDFFKIFRQCTREETLPGFKCLYCPDENINTNDYMKTYHDILFSGPYDAMFFHGSFDVVVPSIVLQESEISGINNVIFKYDFFKDISRVMIGGHWHNGDKYEHMYYTRSLNRWSFNEDEDKGFIYLTYNTDEKSYLVQRVKNPFTDTYISFSVMTLIYKDISYYHALIEDINESLLKDKNKCMHFRIKIIVNDDKIENENGINLLKRKFMNERRVKIIVKDKLKEKRKKELKQKNDMIKDEYSFIQDKNKPISEIIQEFILHQKGKVIPLDVIQSFADKYMKE